MRRRSNLLVLLGIAFFVVGAAIVFLVSKDDGDAASGPDSVEVVVAKDSVSLGALGDEVLANGLYETKRININEQQPDALTSPSQLSNTIFTRSYVDGEQLTSGGLRTRSLLAGAGIQVPAGKEAVALSLDFVNGGAGYISPGDEVNVFAVLKTLPVGVLTEEAAKAGAPYNVPRAELLLTNVSVLDVSQEVAPLRGAATPASVDPAPGTATAARTESTRLTVLLAVDTIDAEKLIFDTAASGNAVYLTRVADDAAPAQPTEGRDFLSILLEEALAAFNRTNPQ